MDKDILNQIKIQALSNPLKELFINFEKIISDPSSKAIWEVLNFYYSRGYMHFRSDEWGFSDIKNLNFKEKTITRPYGKLIQSIYALCKEAHALQGSVNVSVRYSNAYQWFSSVVLELIAYDFENLRLNPKKVDAIEMWKQRIKILETVTDPPNINNFQSEYNPFLHSRISKYSSGLLLLIECGYSLAESVPNFREKYWQPFISAQKEIVRMFESNKSVELIDVLIDFEKQEFQYKKKGKHFKYSQPKKF